MKYKVYTGAPTLAALTGLVGFMNAINIMIPDPYKWIVLVLLMIVLALLILRLARNSWGNPFLAFEDNALIFSKQTIRADDIKHILVNERNGSFIIYFKHRKVPMSVAINRRDAEAIRVELSQWTWRNGVQTKVHGAQKKRIK